MANNLEHFRQFSTRKLMKVMRSKPLRRSQDTYPAKAMRMKAYGLLIERRAL